MPLHSIGSGTISFGLVSIPIKMYSAATSAGVSFNQLHQKCGGRIRQQLICPTCNEVVERGALVKGYEFAKDQYVQFTEEELKALEEESNKMIDIAEFVPLAQVDPIYFEKTYYLGPDKGGEKAYRLLTDAMQKSERVALAKFVMRGKENLVLIRPAQGRAGAGAAAGRGAYEREVPPGTVFRRVSDARAAGRRIEGRRARSDVARAAGPARAGDRLDGGAQAEPRQARLGRRGRRRQEGGYPREEACLAGAAEGGAGPAREEGPGQQALTANPGEADR